MPRVRELDVWLHGEHLGILTAPRIGKVQFRYARGILDRHRVGTPLLSCSLPVRSGSQDAWAFTVGLLPEGQHRQAMAGLAGVPTTDLLGMLARFGRDVAGALIICVGAPDEAASAPAAIPYNDGELDHALAELTDHPLGLYDDSELSIGGLQDKMLLVRLPDGRWARPTHGYPSTHILKIDDRQHHGLVRAEHACLQLARAAGLNAAHSELIHIGDAECIVVERFDRASHIQPDATITVRRVHQEDTCQALGIDPDRARGYGKYEAHGGPSLRRIADLLDSWAPDPNRAHRYLLDQAVFNVAVGNADAHGRNVALLHPTPDTVTLAPLYDTVPTGLWPRLRVDAAMSISGQRRLPAISRDDLVREARSWGLAPGSASNHITMVLDRLHTVLTTDPPNVDTPAVKMIALRVEELLR